VNCIYMLRYEFNDRIPPEGSIRKVAGQSRKIMPLICCIMSDLHLNLPPLVTSTTSRTRDKNYCLFILRTIFRYVIII